jgi:2-methylisocitrate lyase-like PEP mutase family enzyme
MTTQREKAAAFRQLHSGPRLLVLPNAWDVASAKVIEAAGAAAIATSSAGVAFALGFPDGERISRDEMLGMVRRIAVAVEVPVSADVEAGYGATSDAAARIARDVLETGAVGMNLEDAIEGGELLPLELHVERIRAARAAATGLGVPLVINGRTDSFAARGIAPDARAAEAVRRANAYLAAGADCAFVPFVTRPEDIVRLVREIRGPINILAKPGSPPLSELERLGVRRVSVGSAIALAAYGRARRAAMELMGSGTYEAMTDAIPYAEMQQLLR